MKRSFNLALLFLAFAVSDRATAQFSRSLDDTCQSFVQSMKQADETMDRSRPQAYSDIAERIYAALNNVVVEVGLAALPLPQDTTSRLDRSMLVVGQCQQDMTMMYHNAVADAYVALRKAAHLPTIITDAGASK